MKHLLILVLFVFAGSLRAQSGDAAVVERRIIPEQQWQRAAKDLDYSKDVPETPKKQEEEQASPSMPNPFGGLNGQFWGTLFQVLAILLAVAAIAYGIYRMLQEPQNKRIARDGVEITVDNLDNYLHETDLDRFLREALARKDYSQAIRIYYLQHIKHLSDAGAIHWSKEKTNRDYLREMSAHPQGETFRSLTRHYERIWYGNVTLDAARFAELEALFKVDM
jgi:hypothetical protein